MSSTKKNSFYKICKGVLIPCLCVFILIKIYKVFAQEKTVSNSNTPAISAPKNETTSTSNHPTERDEILRVRKLKNHPPESLRQSMARKSNDYYDQKSYENNTKEELIAMLQRSETSDEFSTQQIDGMLLRLFNVDAKSAWGFASKVKCGNEFWAQSNFAKFLFEQDSAYSFNIIKQYPTPQNERYNSPYNQLCQYAFTNMPEQLIYTIYEKHPDAQINDKTAGDIFSNAFAITTLLKNNITNISKVTEFINNGKFTDAQKLQLFQFGLASNTLPNEQTLNLYMQQMPQALREQCKNTYDNALKKFNDKLEK